jgi:hypothetical protein
MNSNKQPLTVKRLPKAGCPDIEISHADHITEMKTSAVKEKLGFIELTNLEIELPKI